MLSVLPELLEVASTCEGKAMGRAGFGVGWRKTKDFILDTLTLMSLQETPVVMSNV